MKRKIAVLLGIIVFFSYCQISFAQEKPVKMSTYGFVEAISNGDTDTVKKYIDSKTDLNKTIMGATPLLYSIDKCQNDMLDYLLQNGADPNFERGVPPLYYAVVKKNKYAAARLLKAGADIQKTYMDVSAKDLAKTYENKDFVNIFESYINNPKTFDPNVYKSAQSVESRQDGRILSANIIYNMNKKDTNLIPLQKTPSVNMKTYNQKVANDYKEYQKNKKILSEEQYKLSIILDKLLRANKLQYQNWRIGIDLDTENINAYAGSANLIIINSSLYDSLYQNEDALAFVVAHELSHLILGHGQIALENNIKINKLEANIQNAKLEAYRQNHLGDINDALGNYGASIGNGISSLAYNIAVAAMNSEMNRIYAQEQKLELNADSEALTLMARAGYDPDRAKDALEFLSNIPNVYTKRSTHPDDHTRLSNINEHLFLNDNTDLKNQGRKEIINSNVLTLKKSSDKKTVVLSKGNNCSKKQYIAVSKEDKLMRKAYKCYLDNDYQNSRNLFNQAYMMNPNNFIPAIYLSYINEYNFKQNQNKKSLAEARRWAKRAYNINPKSKYTIEQQEDIKEIFVSLKEQKKYKKQKIKQFN